MKTAKENLTAACCEAQELAAQAHKQSLKYEDDWRRAWQYFAAADHENMAAILAKLQAATP